MKRLVNGKLEFAIMVIGLAAVLTATAVVQSGSDQDRSGPLESTAATNVVSNPPVEDATSTPTADTPTASTRPAVVLNQNARIKTPEQAAIYAVQMTELRFRAENPQALNVELLPLDVAMQRAQEAMDGDTVTAMDGLQLVDPSEATWCVILSGRFHIPRCPAPATEEWQTRDPTAGCGWLERAVVYFSADGDLRELQLLRSP